MYGRKKTYKRPNGRVGVRELPIDQWHTVIPDTHPGYITWDQYNENLKTLRANAQAHGKDRRNHPPGHGPALLQGLIVCGVCGQRMTLRYHSRHGKLMPDYVCQHHGIEYGKPICQSIPGLQGGSSRRTVIIGAGPAGDIGDCSYGAAGSAATIERKPDKLRYQKVQRAQYQADLAKDRFMNIDPRNRLVADQLEADWNDKLRILI